MKTLGKISLVFFCGFIALLVAGMIVISTTGSYGQLWEAIEGHYNWGDYSYSESFPMDEEKMDYSDSKELSLDGVDTIVVEANACEMQAVQEGDAGVLQADFKSGVLFGDDYARMTTEKSGNTLTIRIKQDRTRSNWFRADKIASFSKLDLRIPTGYRGEISLRLNACDATIRDLKLDEKLDLTINAGKLNLVNCEVEDLVLDGNAADSTVESIQVMKKADMQCNAGSLKGTQISAKEIDVDNNAGSTELTKIQGEIKSNCSAGSISLSFAQVIDDVDVHAAAGTTELVFPKGSPIEVEISGRPNVQDSIEWTGGSQYRMKDAKYTVSASGNTSKLILRELQETE